MSTNKEVLKSNKKKPDGAYKAPHVATGSNNARTKKNPCAGQKGSGHLNYG